MGNLVCVFFFLHLTSHPALFTDDINGVRETVDSFNKLL